MSRPELPPTIGLDEAARWLGISYESARRRARAGELPGAFQIGARWRVGRRALLREIDRLAGLTELRSSRARREPARAPVDDADAHIAAPAARNGSHGRTAALVKSSSGPWRIAASSPIDEGPSLVHKRRNSD